MSQKAYLSIVSVIFGNVCIIHLLRVLAGWQAVIGPWVVPVWFSIIVAAVAGVLAVFGVKLSRRFP